MAGARIVLPRGLAIASAVVPAVILGLAALALAPRAFEAHSLLSAQDDPVALADRAVARAFDAAVAAREIEAALAGNDADLAASFLELARERGVPVDPTLAERVETANAESPARALRSFARGFITGEPEDLSSLAGTAVGDLFVLGDIRDAVREGARLATGREADELVLGLACVGLAVTAGTYLSAGAAAPARLGLTVVKAARRSGRIGADMAAWVGREMREVVDLAALRRAAGLAGVAAPVLALRTAREAVKVEKAQGLVRLVGDVGRVQARAGTPAALDALKLAHGPRDMSKVAQLAAAKGGKTRAILKLAGRGAIVLTASAFNLASWMLWAILTALGFVSSLKRAAERMTERHCARRRSVPITLNRERARDSIRGRIFCGKPVPTFPENAPLRARAAMA